MLSRLKNWLSGRAPERTTPSPGAVRKRDDKKAARSRDAQNSVPRPDPEFVDTDDELSGEIETAGPGKNVLIRNKFVREDTGTHETLTILDDSMVDSNEETGIDPYNTGGFDRSRNWDKRFGK